MDLEFSAEQNMLREMVAGICEQYANLDVVRSLEDDPAGYPDEFWKQLVDLDLLGLTLPEAFGGSGQSLLEAAVVYEEFGRSLSPRSRQVRVISRNQAPANCCASVVSARKMLLYLSSSVWTEPFCSACRT